MISTFVGSPLPTGRYTALDISLDAVIAAPGINPYSARGLRGVLSPIDAARGGEKLARTINGTLISIAATQMRKYKLEITGNDNAPPALDTLWVGMPFLVKCHVELAYPFGHSPGRTPVSGSSRTEVNYVYYMPQLTMMVVDWQIDRQEWEQVVSWNLTLEEI